MNVGAQLLNIFDLYGWKRHAAAMVKDIDFVLVQ